MLIRAYGQFWNPDIVEWGKKGPGNKGTLPGTGKWDNETTIEVDVWRQHGIYVLHDDFKSVYVGHAYDQPIGKRLRDHLTDRHAGRWDMFSWYGVYSIKKDGTLRFGKMRQMSLETSIKSIEALAIYIADPPLNRRREVFERAIALEQKESPHPHTIRHYLQQLLDSVEEIKGKV